MAETDVDIKTRILLAARNQFARNGFEGTSVRQICEEAGANVALVSYHFGGKKNLFFAVFDAFMPVREMEQFYKLSYDPVNGLQIIIREVTQFRLNNPEIVRIIQYEIWMRSPRIQVIKSHIFPIWEKLKQYLIQGREQGVFEYRSLPHTTMFVLNTILFHDDSFWSPMYVVDSERLADDLILFVLSALRPGRTNEVTNADK